MRCEDCVPIGGPSLALGGEGEIVGEVSHAPLNYRLAVRLLVDQGYSIGKPARHGTKMVKAQEPPIILPRHGSRDYGKRLTGAIIKQAGLNTREFQSWRSRSPSTRKTGASGRRSQSFPDASRQAER
jgi:hypothetical protein